MPFLSNIGTPELIVIAVVLLAFFGSKKANELAKGLGESSKEIKKARVEFEKALAEEAQITADGQPTSLQESLTDKDKPETDENEEKKGGGA